MTKRFDRDVCVVGGGGHVGLPLALTLANAGLHTVIYDTNALVLELIASGSMPFREDGGEEALQAALASGRLELESEPVLLADCEHVVMIIGTPIDEHLNPDLSSIIRAIESCRSSLRDGQLFILRSTIFPGMTDHVQRLFESMALQIDVAFCPERVAQGSSLEEIRSLPQLVSGTTPRALERSKRLFERICSEIIELEPLEAELAKLMTNAWRYIQFATVNQFQMLASEQKVDFDRILFGCRHNYPRMSSMPGPGLTAGPCLVKDTMQLAAFSQNRFIIGHAAMLINEGMPRHMIELAKRELDLRSATAGILGMAFKAESDDPRDSLSYKLRKLLRVEAGSVLCTDPYVNDASLVPLETVMERSDVLFLATPHRAYRHLQIPSGTVVVDIWNHIERAAAGGVR